MKKVIIALGVGLLGYFAWKKWGKTTAPCSDDPSKPCGRSALPGAAEQKAIGAGIEAGITTPEGGSTQPVVTRTAPEALRPDDDEVEYGAYSHGAEQDLKFTTQGGR